MWLGLIAVRTFQTFLLEEIRNNYELWEYKIHALSTISAAVDLNNNEIFYILLSNRKVHSTNISENIYKCHFFSIHYLKSIDIYNFLVILADNILIKIDAFLWGFLFWIKWYTQKKFWNLNAKLLDFVIGSFPIIKNTSNVSSIACILKNQHLQNLGNIYGESLTVVFIQIIGERA